MSEIESVVSLSAQEMKEIFGQLDENVKKIEKALFVKIIARGDGIRIIGDKVNAERAKRILEDLGNHVRKGNHIETQNVDYAISMEKGGDETHLSDLDDEIICRTVNGKPIRPKTFNQKKYVDAIRENMLVFGLGPAGTGNTYLAMAMAIDAFRQGDINCIILTRPANEDGENLGFLPGDLQSKVDPYLRPLYDAIYQIMGAESYLSNSEKGLIEVATLAYKRGRTKNKAIIIMDEAQNTTPAQMKMFLTRIGFGSKVVVTGDPTQKDLPYGQISGLDVAIRVLEGIDEDIAEVALTSQDVVRHPVVQKIVLAYEEYEKKQNQKARSKDNKRS